ncbi:MAG: DNA cytosine methyltransferase [Ginsengibacter sp.]
MAQLEQLMAVDFFCGGGGMSYGMQQAGVRVLAGIDNEIKCKETYEKNIKDAEFIKANVFDLKEKYLQKKLGLSIKDDNLILIGCSPCQFWSIINTDKTKSEKSKNLLVEFRRFVEYFKPGYVVVENVPGVLRKKEQSGLASFIDWLKEKRNGYTVHFDVHNVYDFGVPQNRRRFTLIANRVTRKEIIPQKKEGARLNVTDVLGPKNGFAKIKAGNKDETDFLHTTASLSSKNIERLKYVKKDGGNRHGFSDIPNLQLKCFVGKDDSFKDTFGRLWWNKPSPTITTKFISVSNGRFAHPEENRGLSLREGAVLQSFPKEYIFRGNSIGSIARIIGNAVPPRYAQSIAEAIINSKT